MSDVRVLVVGPVPPPIDGRAAATEALITELAAIAPGLRVVDTQLAAGRARVVTKLVRCLRAGCLIAVDPPERCFVVASGGAGLLLEAIPLIAARLRRRPAVLLHHSSSYVRSRGALMRAVLWVAGGRVRHLLLSGSMALEFAATYGLRADRCGVLDNAALMSEQAPDGGGPRTTVLHVANLSSVKGSLLVLEVARLLTARGVADLTVVLAGPADAEVKKALASTELESNGVQWLGPVDGAAKERAFAAARVLLLPSTYVHEAQPLVLYEAARAGVIPIAWDAGWIREQMESLGLGPYVLESGDVEGLARLTADLLALSAEEFDRHSANARASFLTHREASRAVLQDLVAGSA